MGGGDETHRLTLPVMKIGRQVINDHLSRNQVRLIVSSVDTGRSSAEVGLGYICLSAEGVVVWCLIRLRLRWREEFSFCRRVVEVLYFEYSVRQVLWYAMHSSRAVGIARSSDNIAVCMWWSVEYSYIELHGNILIHGCVALVHLET